MLSLLRLSTLLSSADPSTFSLVIDEKERQVLHAMAETLLGHESPKKEQIISGLLLDDVNIDGIPCKSHLSSALHVFFQTKMFFLRWPLTGSC